MNDKTYKGGADRLRDPSRLELLEIPRVVALSSENMDIGSMLDVGCGTALFAEAFFNEGCTVSGVDINESMLAEARRIVPSGTFKPGSMESIPFDDASFDLVFLGHVLHEADDLSVALSEVRRVTRNRVAVLEWPYFEEEMGPPLAHRLKPEQVMDAAKAVGFAKVEKIDLMKMTLFRIGK
jgi:ubiquinone/menaquinone biosynthesis C-methylase UbiE